MGFTAGQSTEESTVKTNTEHEGYLTLEGHEKRKKLLLLKPGVPIRVRNPNTGSEIEGRYTDVTLNTLRLMQDEVLIDVSLDSVSDIWAMERGIRKGTTIGAISGGIMGAIFLGLPFYNASVVEIKPDSNVLFLRLIQCTLLGGAIGAGGGALVGAGIDAVTPEWRLIYTSKTVPLDSTALTAGKGISRKAKGSTGLGIGYSRCIASGSVSGSIASRANFWWDIHRCVSFGPEITYYHCLSFRTRRSHEKTQEEYGRSSAAWQVGAATKLVIIHRTVSPFIVGGLSFYSWNQAFLGASAGVGVKIAPGASPYEFYIDYRYHDNIQNLSEHSPPFITIMCGMMLKW
jgi:hypothetical protein